LHTSQIKPKANTTKVKTNLQLHSCFSQQSEREKPTQVAKNRKRIGRITELPNCITNLKSHAPTKKNKTTFASNSFVSYQNTK